jgi:hypothetical protein
MLPPTMNEDFRNLRFKRIEQPPFEPFRCDDGFKHLDTVHDLFLAGFAFEAMRELVPGLSALRNKLAPPEWLAFKQHWEHHPAATFVLQDPFTNWSHKKPRGYSGDATLIDFIYGHESVAEKIAATSELGRSVFQYTQSAPAPIAVRERRDFMANLVDRAALERRQKIDVLSIAAGHLREAKQSAALEAGMIARWVALDQDVESLRNITRANSVQPFQGNVRGLIARKYSLAVC